MMKPNNNMWEERGGIRERAHRTTNKVAQRGARRRECIDLPRRVVRARGGSRSPTLPQAPCKWAIPPGMSLPYRCCSKATHRASTRLPARPCKMGKRHTTRRYKTELPHHSWTKYRFFPSSAPGRRSSCSLPTQTKLRSLATVLRSQGTGPWRQEDGRGDCRQRQWFPGEWS